MGTETYGGACPKCKHSMLMKYTTSHTKFNHVTVGICQDCGNKQKI